MSVSQSCARTGALVLALALPGAVPAVAQTPSTGGASEAPAQEAPPATQPAPAAPSKTATVTLTRSQVKGLQRKLKVRADGQIGSRTRAALRRWQNRRGLRATGRPNLETIEAMRLPFADDLASRPQSAPAAGAAAAVEAARSRIGDPYRSAGSAPGGFDCSGLTMWAFARAGVELPHSSFEQFKQGTAVDRDAIQAGDLVFFSTAGPGASDVGIAVSATRVVSSTTRGVMEHATFDEYWGGHYVGARRLGG